MNSSNLQILLFAYLACSALFALMAILLKRMRLTAFLLISLSFVGMFVVLLVASQEAPGRNFVVDMASKLAQLSRQEVTAFALGGAAALPVMLAFFAVGGSRLSLFSRRMVAILAVSGVLVCGAGFIAKDLISPYLPNPGSSSGSVGIGQLSANGFVIEDYSDTEIIPVRVAVSNDGRVFVSGHAGIAAQDGVVAELIDDGSGDIKERVVARMLNRPYGLTVRDDDIYVSRSGQHTLWKNGKVDQKSTGAITQLRDLDNDGVMDWYHDVVGELPGAKGPDYLHQNNDLAFGEDGALYITTANHSDGYPATDPIEGAILRFSGDDYEEMEIFATGLRNPFGLTFDGDGVLYATDNDAQAGRLGGNLGDKIIEVKQGAFYGHPYAHDTEEGVTRPLLRSSFALGGLAYAPVGSFSAPWDDALYVVIYGEGRIARVDIETSADGTKTAELKLLATVPGAVDIDITKSGEMYIGVYPDKIVKISEVQKLKVSSGSSE